MNIDREEFDRVTEEYLNSVRYMAGHELNKMIPKALERIGALCKELYDGSISMIITFRRCKPEYKLFKEYQIAQDGEAQNE